MYFNNNSKFKKKMKGRAYEKRYDGYSSKYISKLKESDIEFINGDPELLKFLNNSNEKQFFHLVSSSEIEIGAIKVLKALKTSSLYGDNDNYIFLDLKSFNKKRYQIFKAFKSTRYNLLAIKWELSVEYTSIFELYQQLSEILAEYSIKKFILIAEKDNPLSELFKTHDYRNFHQDEFKSCLNDLTTDSQQKVLAKEVVFFGRKLKLSSLLEQTAISTIDFGTLVELMKEEIITIGCSSKQMKFLEVDYVKSYEDLSVNNLIDAFSANSSHCENTLFMISGIKVENNDQISDELVKLLKKSLSKSEVKELDEKIYSFKHQVSLISDELKFVVGDDDAEDDCNDENDLPKIVITNELDKEINFSFFKALCLTNNYKIIYWVNVTEHHGVHWKQQYVYHYKLCPYQNICIYTITKDMLIELLSFHQCSFVISNVDDTNVDRFMDGFKFEENNSDIYQKIKNNIRNSDEEAEALFQNQCQSTYQNIFWLKEKNGRLVLRFCNTNVETFKERFQSLSLRWMDENFLIISGMAGCGKTTLLLKMFNERIQNKHIIFIDLNKYQNVIANLPYCKEDYSEHTIVDFLSVIDDNCFEGAISKNLFKLILQYGNPRMGLLLLFDSFHEIEFNLQLRVLLLLKFLKTETIASIIVTTRPEKCGLLQNEFLVIANEMHPLTEQMQTEYLKDFFNITQNIICRTKKKSNYMAIDWDTCIKEVSNKPQIQFFLKNEASRDALTLRMVAEVFIQISKEVVFGFESLNSVKLADKSDLFKQFIDLKYNVYFQEKFGSDSEISKSDKNKLKSSYDKLCRKLALEELFYKQGKSSPFPCDTTMDEKETIRRIGLINNDFEFIHFTLASYFVSDLLCHLMGKKEINAKKYEFARKFIIEKEQQLMKYNINSFIDLEKAKLAPPNFMVFLIFIIALLLFIILLFFFLLKKKNIS